MQLAVQNVYHLTLSTDEYRTIITALRKMEELGSEPAGELQRRLQQSRINQLKQLSKEMEKLQANMDNETPTQE